MGGAGLPTGTVTFLFTDVEGSTRLLYELGHAPHPQLSARLDPAALLAS
jgi:class 3 adenylate cyclase